MTRREFLDRLGKAEAELIKLRLDVLKLVDKNRTLEADLAELETVSAEEKKKLEQEVKDLQEKLIERTNLLLEAQEKLLMVKKLEVQEDG